MDWFRRIGSQGKVDRCHWIPQDGDKGGVGIVAWYLIFYSLACLVLITQQLPRSDDWFLVEGEMVPSSRRCGSQDLCARGRGPKIQRGGSRVMERVG